MVGCWACRYRQWLRPEGCSRQCSAERVPWRTQLSLGWIYFNVTLIALCRFQSFSSCLSLDPSINVPPVCPLSGRQSWAKLLFSEWILLKLKGKLKWNRKLRITLARESHLKTLIRDTSPSKWACRSRSGKLLWGQKRAVPEHSSPQGCGTMTFIWWTIIKFNLQLNCTSLKSYVSRTFNTSMCTCVSLYASTNVKS